MMEQEFFQAGLAKEKAGDRLGALNEFSRALQTNPTMASAHYRRGLVLFDLGDRQGALADYDRAIALQANFTDALLARALLKLTATDVQGAIADAMQSLQSHAEQAHPESAAAHHLLAMAYQKLEDYPAAIAAYERAATAYLLAKNEASCRQCLENKKHLKALLPPTAADDFSRALQQFKTGDYHGAFVDCTVVIQREPHHARAYCLRGVVQSKLGNFQAALADLNRAMQLAPEDDEVCVSRALLRTEMGDALGAIADFTELLRHNPDRVDAYVGRGMARCRLSDYRAAIEDYSRALQLQPDDPQIHCDRGAAREQFGDVPGALLDSRQAVNLWFGRGQWEKYQQALEVMRRLQEKVEAQRRNAPEKAIALSQNDLLPSLHVQESLLSLVGGNQEIARRLIEIARQNYPGMTEEWYWKKVIFDLESRRDPEV